MKRNIYLISLLFFINVTSPAAHIQSTQNETKRTLEDRNVVSITLTSEQAKRNLLKKNFIECGISHSDLHPLIFNYIGQSGLDFEELLKFPKIVTAQILLTNGGLACGYQDGTIVIWNIDEKQPLLSFKAHSDEVTTLCELPNGNLASSSTRSFIKIWDLNNGHLIKTLEGQSGWQTYLCLLPNNELAANCSNGMLKVWNTKTFKSKSIKCGSWVTAMCLLPNGKLVVGRLDKKIKIIDPNNGKPIKFECAGVPDFICILKNGNLAYVCNNKGYSIINICDSNSFKSLNEIKFKGSTCKICEIGNNNLAAIGDYGARVYDTLTGECLKQKDNTNFKCITKLADNILILGSLNHYIWHLNKLDIL